MIQRLLLLALAIVGIPICVHTQTTWEPIEDGVEGDAMSSVWRTRSGALLGGGERSIVRFDRAADRWRTTITTDSLESYQLFAADSSGAIYAAGYGPLLRSTDDGRTWSVIDSSTSKIVSLDGRVVLLLGSRGRSTDGGRSWDQAENRALRLITDGGAGRVLAVEHNSLLESLDTGRTWQLVSETGPAVMLFADREIVIAGSFLDVRRSTDGGGTWSIDSMPGAAVVVAQDGDMFLSSSGPHGMRATDGIHRSTDRGATWSRMVSGVAAWLAIGDGSELWAGFDTHARRSTDDGRTWERVDRGLHQRRGTLYTAADETIYGTIYDYTLNTGNGGTPLYELMRAEDDGRSWRSLHDSVTNVTLMPGGWGMMISVAHVIAGQRGYLDVAKTARFSTDRGEHWSVPFTGWCLRVVANAAGMAMASVVRADTIAMMLTTDSGATWRVIDAPRSISSSAITPRGSIIAGTSEYVPGGSYRRALYRSDDSGATWLALSSIGEAQLYAYGDDVVVAIVTAGDTITSPRILRSTDNGDTWSTTFRDVQPLYVVRDSTALVLFSYARPSRTPVLVSHSTDSGATWQQTQSTEPIAELRPTHTHGKEIFAYPNDGIVRSTDHGVTWEPITTGNRYRPWFSVATNSRVMIASSDRLYRAASPAAAPATPTPQLNVRATDLAVAPVPAGGRLTIDIECAGRLRIVDARGALVIEHALEGVGRHELDVSALSEGHYVVSLVCGGEVRAGRIVIQR